MRRVVAAVLASLSLTCAIAIGAPRDVVSDYFADGRLDISYSIEDLRGALAFARGNQAKGGQYSAFADAVNAAITDDLVGTGDAAQQQLTTPRSRTDIAPAPAPVEAQPSNLPVPPTGEPTQSVPLALPIIAVLAGVLLLAGLGTSVWRRIRR